MKVASSVANDAIINGHHLTEYGAFLTAWSVPPIPTTVDYEQNVPAIIGVYDGGTEVGRLDVTMQIGFWTQTGGRKEIRRLIRQFMSAVDPRNGYIPVSFQEDPDFYLMLKVTSTSGSSVINMSPESGTGEAAATIDVQWKAADPHWYSNVLGTVTVGNLSYSASGVLANAGGALTPLRITIRATAAVSGGFQIGMGGKIIAYNGDILSGDVIYIDTDTWEMTRNGGNMIGAWSGDFPLLPPGNSNIVINKAGLTMTVEFTPRWLA